MYSQNKGMIASKTVYMQVLMFCNNYCNSHNFIRLVYTPVYWQLLQT